LHESAEKIGDLTALPGTGTVAVDELALGAAVSIVEVEGVGGAAVSVGALVDATGLTGVGAPAGQAASRDPTATNATAETMRVMGSSFAADSLTGR
jgi:hypothetical protein